MCWAASDHFFPMQLSQGICLIFLNTKGGDAMTDPIIWSSRKHYGENLRQQNFFQPSQLRPDPNILPLNYYFF
jgi:hypothetical protein